MSALKVSIKTTVEDVLAVLPEELREAELLGYDKTPVELSLTPALAPLLLADAEARLEMTSMGRKWLSMYRRMEKPKAVEVTSPGQEVGALKAALAARDVELAQLRARLAELQGSQVAAKKEASGKSRLRGLLGQIQKAMNKGDKVKVAKATAKYLAEGGTQAKVDELTSEQPKVKSVQTLLPAGPACCAGCELKEDVDGKCPCCDVMMGVTKDSRFVCEHCWGGNLDIHGIDGDDSDYEDQLEAIIAKEPFQILVDRRAFLTV